MELFRVHAYEVTPQRLADAEIPPRGGAFAADAEFTGVLEEYLSKTKLLTQATVNLRRHPAEETGSGPTHELRDAVVLYCFGTSPKAKQAAVTIARKLGDAMDRRSVFTLLMLAAYRDGPKRRLIVWAFPKDEPFHFSVRGNRAKIKVLTDAFSRSSSFKKAALFEGSNTDTSFWSARVIDRQAERGMGGAAEYWIDTFLDSQPSLSGKAGTRLLAQCLRRTHEALSDQSDKDQISSSIVAVRTSQKKKWSLTRYANEYLADAAKQTFLDNSPPESRSATFTFIKDEFDRKVNFRVFRLQDNVVVAAPFGSIGKSVKLQDGTQRKLKCEGIIVAEKVRAQNVG